MGTEENSSDDLIFGRHPVLELLRVQGECRVNKLWLLKGAAGAPVEEVLKLARERGIVFQWVERRRLDEMARRPARQRDGPEAGRANHQGVVARVAPVGYKSLDEISQGNPSPLLLLDGIEDPHNLGAILRNAAFFGARGAVIPRWRAAGLSGTVMKASAGALAKVPLAQVANMAQAIVDLKKKGYWIYGADGKGAALDKTSFNAPFALVIGAEGFGLHRLVKERCDALVSIPGSGQMESLNASCASAVLLFHLFGNK